MRKARIPETVETIAILSAKGQLVIPAKIREALGVSAGSELNLKLAGDKLEVSPAKHNIKELFGILKCPGAPPLSVSDIDKAIQETILKEIDH